MTLKERIAFYKQLAKGSYAEEAAPLVHREPAIPPLTPLPENRLKFVGDGFTDPCVNTGKAENHAS